MAASIKGTAHFFGTKMLGGTAVHNAIVTSITMNETPELDEQVVDGNGVTVETRLDNRLKSISATLRMPATGVSPNVGGVVALTGATDNGFNATYEVASKGQAYNAGTHMDQTVELRCYEGITYPNA